MRKAIGATLKQFKDLAADNVLPPRTRIPTIKSRWRLEDGRVLVDDLLRDDRAQIRSEIGIDFIVEAIRSDRLKVGLREDLIGYGGIFVLKQQIDRPSG